METVTAPPPAEIKPAAPPPPRQEMPAPDAGQMHTPMPDTLRDILRGIGATEEKPSEPKSPITADNTGVLAAPVMLETSLADQPQIDLITAEKDTASSPQTAGDANATGAGEALLPQADGETVPLTKEAPVEPAVADRLQEPPTVNTNEPAVSSPLDTEPSRTPETERQIVQRAEIQTLSNAILNRRIASATLELSSMDEATAIQMLSENPGKNALLAIGVLRNNPTAFSGSLEVSTENGAIHLTNILQANGESYTCVIDGQEEPVVISLQQIINAAIISESDTILGQFAEDSPERALLEIQIQRLKNPDAPLAAPGTAESQAIDLIIRQTAEANHIPTTDSLRTLRQNIDARLAGETLTPEQRTQQENFASAVERIANERNILDFPSLKEAFSAAGISGEDAVRNARNAVKEAEETANRNPDNNEAKIRLGSAKVQELIIKYASRALADDAEVATLMKDMINGTADIARAKAFQEALKTGSPDAITRAVGAAAITDEDKTKIKDELAKMGKKGNLWLVLMALVFSVTGEVTGLGK